MYVLKDYSYNLIYILFCVYFENQIKKKDELLKRRKLTITKETFCMLFYSESSFLDINLEL